MMGLQVIPKKKYVQRPPNAPYALAESVVVVIFALMVGKITNILVQGINHE